MAIGFKGLLAWTLRWLAKLPTTVVDGGLTTKITSRPQLGCNIFSYQELSCTISSKVQLHSQITEIAP